MTRFKLSDDNWVNIRSISLTPFTEIIHLVLSLVSSPRRLPIPAAKIIACILLMVNFGRASRLAVTELRLPGYAFGTVADIKKRPLQHSTAMRIVAKVR